MEDTVKAATGLELIKVLPESRLRRILQKLWKPVSRLSGKCDRGHQYEMMVARAAVMLVAAAALMTQDGSS
jgi:hypothetical protein